MATPTLLDAVNAAVDGGTLPESPPEPEKDETTTDDTTDAGTESGDDSNVDTSASDDSGADDSGTDDNGTDADAEEGDDEGGSDSDESGDQGEPLAGAKGAKPAEAPAKPEVKPEVPAKQKDPVNDPVDQRLKTDTKERISSLIDLVKEKDVVVRQHNELMDTIRDSSASPEQYGQALTYIKAVNSGDPKQLESALAFMQQEVAVISRMLNKPVPTDLMKHADLQQMVKDGKLPAEIAAEVASRREQDAFVRQRQTRQTQAEARDQQTREAFEQAQTQAKQDLTELGNELAQNPDYAQRRAVAVPQLQAEIKAGLHPSRWASRFATLYTKAKVPAAAAAPAARQQPRRPKNPAGGQQRAPASLLDAINLAVDGH